MTREKLRNNAVSYFANNHWPPSRCCHQIHHNSLMKFLKFSFPNWNSVNDLWLKSLLSDHLSKIWRMHITGIPSWDGLWTMDLTSSVLEMDWSFIIFDSSYHAHVSLFSSFYSNPKQQTLKSILDLGNHLWRS